MTYCCVGFDVRVWPCNGILSVGDSGWSRNKDIYDQLRDEFDITENYYQILQIESQEILRSVQERILKYEFCNLIAIHLPCSIALLNERKYGYPLADGISLVNFKSLGVDVADVNGFYSVLSNEIIRNFRKSSNLILEDDVIEIFEVVQLAGFVDGNHAPYCAVKISSLK